MISKEALSYLYYGGTCQVQIPKRQKEIYLFIKKYPDIRYGISISGITREVKRSYSATFQIYFPYLDQVTVANIAKTLFNFEINGCKVRPSRIKYCFVNKCNYIVIHSYELFEYLYTIGFNPGIIRRNSTTDLCLDDNIASIYDKTFFYNPFARTKGSVNTYEEFLEELEDEIS